jgi:hypothetical protein
MEEPRSRPAHPAPSVIGATYTAVSPLVHSSLLPNTYDLSNEVSVEGLWHGKTKLDAGIRVGVTGKGDAGVGIGVRGGLRCYAQRKSE